MSPFSLHQRFSLARDCAKYVTWPNILQLVGEYPRIFENDLNDNKHNRLHLARKYARIFVLGHYLFLEAHSFPRATLLENCSPLGTDLVECPRTNILAYFRAKWRLLFPTFKIYTLFSRTKFARDSNIISPGQSQRPSVQTTKHIEDMHLLW